MPARGSVELVEFDRRLKDLSRHALLTAALIAVNIVIWVLMVVKGANWLDPSADMLRAWGANYGPFTSCGEGWRLVTCLFIHAGIVQLAVNQWALYQLGNWLERFFGSIGFLLLYFLAGFAGGVMGVRWRPDEVLAGNTSAVAGLIGALAAFYWRTPGEIPSLALNRLRAGTFVFLAYNIGVEMYRRRIDSGGFFGGLATGFLIGLLLVQPIVTGEHTVRWRRNGLLAAAGLLMALLASVVVRPPPPDFPAEVSVWYESRQKGNDRYSKAEADFKADKITAQDFVRVIEQEIVPDIRHRENHLKELDVSQLTTIAAEQLKAIQQSMELRRQAYELVADALWQGDAASFEPAAKKAAEAQELEDRVLAALERQQKKSGREQRRKQ